MPVQKMCTVAEAVRLNEFAYSLTLEVGEEMTSQTSCGQFVHIKCGEERLLRRPISICDPVALPAEGGGYAGRAGPLGPRL